MTRPCAARPVAVGSPASRGVVAAASYEARQFGVRSALPSVTARRRCPDLIFVKPRSDVYRAVARQIHTIFAEYTPLIQPLSLDEAYLDVTENLRGLPTACTTAKEIRASTLAETGLTASAGIVPRQALLGAPQTQWPVRRDAGHGGGLGGDAAGRPVSRRRPGELLPVWWTGCSPKVPRPATPEQRAIPYKRLQVILACDLPTLPFWQSAGEHRLDADAGGPDLRDGV